MLRIVLAAAVFAACAGCNTVAGLGEDLQAIGGAVTDAANGTASGKPSKSTARADNCAHNATGKVPSPACPPAKR